MAPTCSSNLRRVSFIFDRSHLLNRPGYISLGRRNCFAMFFVLAHKKAYFMLSEAVLDRIIDDPDRRILRELQRDSSRTVMQIAEAVGLSHAPCWRRIQRLREAGYILRESALLDRSKLGWDTEFFVYVKFSAQGRGDGKVLEFRRKIIAHDRVIGAYIVLGNYDLMLHIVARGMRDYEEFYLEHLSGKAELADINSMTVMSALKEAQVPV